MNRINNRKITYNITAMKKYLSLPLLIVLAFTMRAQDVHDYKIEVGQFDKIKVMDNVNVVYRCLSDSTGLVQYRGEKEFADAFIITPRPDGTLRIQVSTEDVGNPDLPTLYVYSDFLTVVENSSDFTVVIENPAPCAEFKAVQIGNGVVDVENVKTNKLLATLNTGNGTVNVSGKTQTANFKMIGTGVISADRLMAKDVQCTIVGSGSIGCYPEVSLSVKGIGSTKIYYKGHPHIKKLGGGRLYQLPEDRSNDIVTFDDDEDSSESVTSDYYEEEQENDVEEEDITVATVVEADD